VKKKYFSILVVLFLGLLSSGCGESETTESIAKENGENITSEGENAENATTEENVFSELMQSQVPGPLTFDVDDIMNKDASYNNSNNVMSVQYNSEVVSVYERKNNTYVIFRSNLGDRATPPASTLSYYLTTLKNEIWSEPIKLFEVKIESPEDGTGLKLLNPDNEIFSKKPENYEYLGMRGDFEFVENKLYLVYPDTQGTDAENIAIQMVEFESDGSISKNNIIYNGPDIINYIDIKQRIIQTSKGEVFVGGEDFKNNEYREIGETLGKPEQIKDNYNLLDDSPDYSRILYIDFNTDLAYIYTRDGIKMLNIKTGDPVYENGEDKVLSIEGTVLKANPDTINNYLYFITDKEAIVTDIDLNEISSTYLENFDFFANEDTKLSFYKYGEYERKPSLNLFVIPKIGIPIDQIQ